VIDAGGSACCPRAKGLGVIQVQDLTKVYGETVAVDGVSFSVPKGEILGFLGPNGAGKTTTMRVLTGYTPPTSGRATVGGFDLATQSTQVRQILGYLPENGPLYPDMTPRGLLNFFADARGLSGRRKRERIETKAVVHFSHADDRALAAVPRGRVGLLHDRPQPDRLERVVRAPAVGEAFDFLDHRVRGLHGMRCSESFGHFQLVVIQVDRNDLLCAGEHRSLDHGNPDATASKNRHG
jgi:ABC-type uncharacterized transport system YnjBCD ATPase subunit